MSDKDDLEKKLQEEDHHLTLSDVVHRGDELVHHAIDVAHHDVEVVERRLSRFQEWLAHEHQKVLIFSVAVLLVIFTGGAAYMLFTDSFTVEGVGYGGVWFLHFVGAASIVIPVPSIFALCAAAAPEVGLNPLILGLCAGSAEALGEITGYAIGLGGRNVLEKNKYYPKVHAIMDRYGARALFVVGVIPNPIFDVMGFAAGSLGYPLDRFIATLLIAKSIKSTGVAYLCFFGVHFMTDMIQRVF